MKKSIVFGLLIFIISGNLFAANEASMSIDITLEVESQIIAHKGADITMLVGEFEDTTTGVGGALASGSAIVGYFDSNANTNFSFQGNALNNLMDGGTDVMATRYTANLDTDGTYGAGEFASESLTNTELAALGSVDNIDPTEGYINVKLDVEADVEWGDEAGQYASQFIITAVCN